MNNGKVRIYELSKELNLENKDILAICDQLQIAYKSHSSTITEAEAEGIRSAAQQYSSTQVNPSTASPVRKSSAPTVKPRNNTPLNSQKKQQILEIRRPVTRSDASGSEKPELLGPPALQTSLTSEATIAGMPTELEPSDRVAIAAPTADAPLTVKPASSRGDQGELNATEPIAPVVPAKPLHPSKAEPSQSADHPVAEDAAKSIEVKPAAVKPAEAKPTEAKPTEAKSAEAKPVVAAKPPTLNAGPVGGTTTASKPEASKPEASKADAVKSESPSKSNSGPKPEAPAKPATPARPVLNSKPILKTKAASSGEKAAPASPGKPSGDGKRSGDRRPAAPSKAPIAPANKPQIVELKRPKPIAPTEEGAAEEPTREQPVLKGRPSRNATPEKEAGSTVELLAKPTPPKARRKVWEDEDEESAEKAKVGPKAKRRGPRIEEDDDEDFDLLDDDDSAVTPAQVSLSLARPPKPKSASAAKPVATSTPTSQPKRRQFTRRDRRDQNSSKVEKPEIITLTGGVTVQELAQMMAVSDTEIIRNLFMKGIAATVTQTLDVSTATMVAEEMGVLVDQAEKESEAKKVIEMISEEDLENLQRRPPVVTIMGHVDHGKTTLLDSIRKTKVAAGEAGGITQHIGAYHVDVEHNGEMQQVVFLDTPGHEAFTAMRARGARVTDVAILVVAADDGVRPQTIEAISHAKAAGVPIVVAINKVDKEEAQPDRVKQELTEFELVPEEWGGSTVMVPVSAMTGQNLDTLLEMILLVSEVEDLHANPNRLAKGTVIEANLDKAKGPVATLLVQNGTLHVGDIIVAGSALGKVRAMVDDRGRRVKEASPSFAVEVLGLGDVPAAGDEFEVYKDEKEARAVADSRAEAKRQSRLMAAMSSRRVSLNTLSSKAQEGELKELNIVMKADVQGSVEAILGSLKQLPQNEVQVRVLFAAPGEISETDVDLAAASEAVLIGFNTTLATGARQAADRAGVDVREYNIIYNLLDDIQAAMEGLLEPELVEEPLGQVEVRAVFPVGKGAVAGCYIQSGKAIRNCKIRVKRRGNLIFEGNLDSLKRMKEDTKEVNAGYECGIGIDNFNAWEEGDIIETFRMVTKRRTLTPSR
ncbi:translation initiation factor IF-2 [Alkalinema sp. FACHB-956]|uniref:translation initiation factor IF-2 n=1 Tax=Alkalinema sp. FACHB-956 TaxID=2692768 RepID=UPI0016867090|nr:translation initiation factor IF-2 [Alkalinema sp. FACHB-956]MBD2328306.1 translation initiation factor IF-2 [Alkalinema sp. FACHB-956]